MLLVNPGNPDDMLSRMQGIVAKGSNIYILGGEAALPSSVEGKLKAAGYTPKRLAGASRYDTNIAILEEQETDGQRIIIADGSNYADSLSASSAGVPIMVVNKNGLSDKQKAFLKDMNASEVFIVGGNAAVPDLYDSQIKSVTGKSVKRLSGANRYATSKLIADTFYSDAKAATVAYGKDYPDGLSAGPLAKYSDSPVLLITDSSYDTAEAFVKNSNAAKGYVIGGTSRISDKTAKTIFGALKDDGSESGSTDPENPGEGGGDSGSTDPSEPTDPETPEEGTYEAAFKAYCDAAYAMMDMADELGHPALWTTYYEWQEQNRTFNEAGSAWAKERNKREELKTQLADAKDALNSANISVDAMADNVTVIATYVANAEKAVNAAQTAYDNAVATNGADSADAQEKLQALNAAKAELDRTKNYYETQTAELETRKATQAECQATVDDLTKQVETATTNAANYMAIRDKADKANAAAYEAYGNEAYNTGIDWEDATRFGEELGSAYCAARTELLQFCEGVPVKQLPEIPSRK